MKLKLVLCLLVCLGCVSVAAAAAPTKEEMDKQQRFNEKNYAAGAALCKGADVYFACQIDYHLLALCADAEGDGVNLRYSEGDNVLLSLPRNPDDLTSVTVGNLTYAGHAGSYMRFKDGKATYLLQSAMGGTWKQAGLAKLVGGKTVEEFMCPAGTDPLRAFLPDLAKKYGYKEEPGRNFESESHIHWTPVK